MSTLATRRSIPGQSVRSNKLATKKLKETLIDRDKIAKQVGQIALPQLTLAIAALRNAANRQPKTIRVRGYRRRKGYALTYNLRKARRFQKMAELCVMALDRGYTDEDRQMAAIAVAALKQTFKL